MQNGSDVLQGRRILIVEDEMLVAMELEQMLAEHGCEILGPASTIDRALALLQRQRPDAAVLDVNLNGTTVAPVAAALREQHVPFVLATGYGGNQAMQPELRGAPRLDKPVNHPRLIRALAGVLAAKH